MEVSGELQPRSLYPLGKSPWYLLDRRLSGPQSRSGRGGEEKNSQPQPGIEGVLTNLPRRSSVDLVSSNGSTVSKWRRVFLFYTTSYCCYILMFWRRWRFKSSYSGSWRHKPQDHDLLFAATGSFLKSIAIHLLQKYVTIKFERACILDCQLDCV
jgi:hypothetical protein